MTKAYQTAIVVAAALAFAPLTAQAKEKAKPKSETAEIDAFFKDIDTSVAKTVKQIDKDLASLTTAPK